MTTYICKCGKEIQKNSTSSTTGNRDVESCAGCPYIVNAQYYKDDKCISIPECRMSESIRYDSKISGRLDDRNSVSVYSLDFSFLSAVQARASEIHGVITDSKKLPEARPSEYAECGRYRIGYQFMQNKIGQAAKESLWNTFFNEQGCRLDLKANDEKALVLKAIDDGIGKVSKETKTQPCVFYDNSNGEHICHACTKTIFQMGDLKNPCEKCESGGPAADCRAYYLRHIEENNVLPEDIDLFHSDIDIIRAYYQKHVLHEEAKQEAAAVNENEILQEPNITPTDLATMDDRGDALTAFDYDILDDDIASRLHGITERIVSARQSYIVEMAKLVSEAHGLLCDTVVPQWDNGTFTKKEDAFCAWCTSVGVSRSSAYRLLDVSKLLNASTEDELSNLQQAPATLLYAASRKDAPAELVDAVKSGDITTNAEYQQLKKALEDAQTQREAAEQEILKWQEMAENQVKVKTDTFKELNVALDDLDAAKSKIKELESRPIEIAVQPADPAEVEKLVQKRVAESERQIENYRNKWQQAEEALESIPQSKSAFNLDDVKNFGKDCAAVISTQCKAFLATTGDLTGEELDVAAIEILNALSDAMDKIDDAIERKEE